MGGYPTVKYGDPTSLEDYKGDRTYEALSKFANENLKPICSVNTMDLCDDEKKAEIEKLMGLSKKDLQARIDVEEKKVEQAESNFKEEVQKLQNKYKQLSLPPNERHDPRQHDRSRPAPAPPRTPDPATE